MRAWYYFLSHYVIFLSKPLERYYFYPINLHYTFFLFLHYMPGICGHRASGGSPVTLCGGRKLPSVKRKAVLRSDSFLVDEHCVKIERSAGYSAAEEGKEVDCGLHRLLTEVEVHGVERDLIFIPLSHNELAAYRKYRLV